MNAYFLKRRIAVVVLVGIILASMYAIISNSPATKGSDPSLDAAQNTGTNGARERDPVKPGPAVKVKIEEIKVGTGAVAKENTEVEVHYVGTLVDGTQFEDSHDKGRPYAFRIGANMVVPGMEQGVTGMRVGGKRKVAIPPELGYADQAMGPIPPNSTLFFDLELMSVK